MKDVEWAKAKTKEMQYEFKIMDLKSRVADFQNSVNFWGFCFIVSFVMNVMMGSMIIIMLVIK